MTNNSHAYYSAFEGTVPAAQLALFPGQTGTTTPATTSPGVLGMAWHTWTIAKVGATVTWSLDGKPIATASRATLGGSDVFLGFFDTNTARPPTRSRTICSSASWTT